MRDLENGSGPSAVTVFLVEDNEVDVEAVRRAFRKRGLSNPIVVARDGQEALERLRSGSIGRPFVMLLDLNLPRMSGLELLGALRAAPRLRDVVAFVLTTSQRDEDVMASYDLNVAGYVAKSGVGDGLEDLLALLRAYCQVVHLPPERSGA